jgi:hypothetical protein
MLAKQEPMPFSWSKQSLFRVTMQVPVLFLSLSEHEFRFLIEARDSFVSW